MSERKARERESAKAQSMTTAQHVSEIVSKLPIVQASKAQGRVVDGTAAQEAQMRAQMARYKLTHLDARSSAELAKAEAEAARCKACRAYAECQYNEYQRGIEPVIGVYSERPNTRTIELSVRICRHRKAATSASAREKLHMESALPGEPLELQECRVSAGKREALERIVKLATGAPQWIYLSGPSGSGKTLVMRLIGSRLMKAKRPVRYITVAEAVAQLRAAEGYAEALARYTEVETLLLEDLGLERRSEFAVEQIALILSKRAGKRTIISSVLSAKEAGEHYQCQDITEQLRGRLMRMRQVRIEQSQ